MSEQKHPCNDHKVKENGYSPRRNYKSLYCFDCEREFTGRFEWQNDERVLVELGPDIKSIF